MSVGANTESPEMATWQRWLYRIPKSVRVAVALWLLISLFFWLSAPRTIANLSTPVLLGLLLPMIAVSLGLSLTMLGLGMLTLLAVSRDIFGFAQTRIERRFPLARFGAVLGSLSALNLYMCASVLVLMAVGRSPTGIQASMVLCGILAPSLCFAAFREGGRELAVKIFYIGAAVATVLFFALLALMLVEG